MRTADGFALSEMTKDDIDQDFAHVSAVIGLSANLFYRAFRSTQVFLYTANTPPYPSNSYPTILLVYILTMPRSVTDPAAGSLGPCAKASRRSERGSSPTASDAGGCGGQQKSQN